MASFSGGERLRERLEELSRRIGDRPDVKVGFLAGASYPDGTPVATVAAVQEFGTRIERQRADGSPYVVEIPSRPFFRNMIAASKGGWSSAIAKNLKATDFDVNRTLDRMGQGIKGQLQQSIRDTNDPPLAPSTIAAKGFSTPLIDTGHMLNSVDYRVEDGSS